MSEMDQDTSINELYYKLRSYFESLLPQVLQQANHEEYDVKKHFDIKYAGASTYFGHPIQTEIDEMLIELGALKPPSAHGTDSNDDFEGALEAEYYDVPTSLPIAEDEKDPAEGLRRCCDRFGKEKRNMLMASAGYLLELGKIYKNYAIKGEGMPQKLNFIKSSALIVGALIRYSELEQPEEQLAEKELLKLHENVLKASPADRNQEQNIYEFSQKIIDLLDIYREKFSTKVGEITCIGKNKSGEANFEQKQKKIDQVKNLCEETTKSYLEIMKMIAKKCVSILGVPPCNFAIVGLGSLARKEVTLYSDFEHVVVLEENQNSTDVKEYFRWFTTLFHIIIVGLEETIIPSVHVKSLCDVYPDGSYKNWFSDENTPCGISFDGMMPHACKIPLGRQIEAQFRKHTVELIQPISVMANFLTKEEEIKNGYFLSEVLSKTCFVYGSQDVYDEFCRESQRVIAEKSQKDFAQQQLRNLILNTSKTTRRPSSFIGPHNMSIKASTYRPIATMLSCIAALRGIKAQSSFEIVDELKEKGVIDEGWYHELMYAVAVTLEVRMKTYAMTGHQRKSLTQADVANLVGESSAIYCYKTLTRFAMASHVYAYRLWKAGVSCGELTFPSSITGYCQADGITLLSFGKTVESTKLGLSAACEIFKSFKNGKMAVFAAKFYLQVAAHFLSQCFFLLYSQSSPHEGCGPPDESILLKFEWFCEVNLQLIENADERSLGLGHQIRSIAYFLKNLYKEALDEYDKWLRLRAKFNNERSFPLMSYLGIEFLEPEIMRRALNAEELMKRLEHRISTEMDDQTYYILRVAKCRALLDTGLELEAKDELRVLTTDVEEDSRKLGKSTYQSLLTEIHKQQMEKLFLADIQFTLRLLSETTANDFVEEQKFMTPEFRNEINERVVVMADPKAVVKLSEESQRRQTNISDVPINVWLHKMHTSCSYAELIKSIKSMLEGYKMDWYPDPMDPDIRATHFIYHVSCVMTLLEKVRNRDTIFAANELLYLPGKVKCFKLLQPFLYAFLGDCLPLNPFGSSTNTLLMKLACQQNQNFKALFGMPSECSKVYNIALVFFTKFNFSSCAKMLWKLLHKSKDAESVMTKSNELFLTTVLTVIVLQKRQTPPKCFTKTHEISMRHFLYLSVLTAGQLEASAKMGFGYFGQPYLNSNDPLTPYYNMAVEFSHLDREKSARLFWKLLHAPNVTDYIQGSVVELLSRIVFDHLSIETYCESA